MSRENHQPRPDISKGTLLLKKPDMYTLKKLIGYTRTNTNIGPLTKLFLWFKLVINPLALAQYPISLKSNGTFFRARTAYTNSQAGSDVSF
ncbi:hypothetical protein Hanom_Chr10g00933991 [Helianthus anomalus]